ncbi:MAG: chemotaxis protein CheA [Cyclobacteriaceae bacterium]|nr:chemotaxis protein CheA [Cyclobacteriaceae bacterium]
MSSKEEEYKEMFLSEALQNYEQLNELFTVLEKDKDDTEAIDSIFRITHTLKGNAMGMGFEAIAELSHVMEDVFSEVKEGNIKLSKSLFDNMFKANDKLGTLIDALTTDEKVSYKGILTKLNVILRKAREKNQPKDEAETPDTNEKIKGTTQEPVVPETESQPEPEPEKANEPQEDTVSETDTSTESGKKPFGKLGEMTARLFKSTKQSEEETDSDISTEPEPESSVESTQPVSETPMETEEVENEQSPDIVEEEQELPEPYFENNVVEEEVEKVVEEEKDIEPEEEQVEEEDEIEEKEVEEEIEEESATQRKIAFSDVVQIPIRKLDALMNQVEQLIIERDRLMAISDIDINGRSNSDFTSLQRITSDLQYSVMDVRLVQIGFLFKKFHRVIRDVASIESKQVSLVLKGTDVEIDRNILKIMSDSLVHLVRNSVSHGIEDAQTRKQRGKPEEGVVTLNARNEKDNVIVEISDDGNGIETEIIRKKIVEKGLLNKELADQLSENEVLLYIFEPGFSNAEKITEVSGRGVGMDVVKRATESIGGQISVETEVGKGSTIILKLPSSMAVKGALLFLLGKQEFAFALTYTEAVISLYKHEIYMINSGLMCKYLDKTISVIFLEDLLSMDCLDEISDEGAFHNTYHKIEDDQKLDVIVVSHSDRFIGIVVDKLLQQKEIVEKTISKPLDNVKLLTGTTILGNGNVCLVVDAAAIADILFKSTNKSKIMEMV